MAVPFYYFPESEEFFFRDLPVSIKIYLIKELLGADFSEIALPVLQRLLFVDIFAWIDVKYFKDSNHFLFKFLAKILYKISSIKNYLLPRASAILYVHPF